MDDLFIDSKLIGIELIHVATALAQSNYQETDK
jgi:hypothetical protein